MNENGVFIKGSYFSDLLLIYYLDNKFKRIIFEYTLEVERHFDVSIKSCKKVDKKEIEDFGGKIKFFNSCSKREKEQIVGFYCGSNNITNHIMEKFVENIENIRKLRNLCAHHDPIAPFDNAVELSQKINSLGMLLDERTFALFRNDIREVFIKKYSFSKSLDKNIIFKFYSYKFGFKVNKKLMEVDLSYDLYRNILHYKKIEQ